MLGTFMICEGALINFTIFIGYLTFFKNPYWNSCNVGSIFSQSQLAEAEISSLQPLDINKHSKKVLTSHTMLNTQCCENYTSDWDNAQDGVSAGGKRSKLHCFCHAPMYRKQDWAFSPTQSGSVFYFIFFWCTCCSSHRAVIPKSS